MSALLYTVFTVLQIILLIWGIRLYQRQKSWGLMFITIIAAGLVYDNLIIALGTTLGVGSLLETISIPRFLVHAVFTPLLFMAGYEMARRADIKWFDSQNRYRAAWGITTILVFVGLWQGVFSAHLKPVCHDGTLRYAERVSESQICPEVEYTEAELNERGLPPIASIVTIVLVGIEGLAIGRKIGWWGLLIGAVIMFVGAAIPASRVGPVVANGAEVVLVGFALATEMVLQKRAGLATNAPSFKTV